MPATRLRATRSTSIGRGAGRLNLFARAAMFMDFTTGVLDPRVTFTRASGGTIFTPSGSLSTVATDAARFDHDPVTLAPRGLLIEGARTNLVLNSATLATQNVTVTAVAHTLSFYGTGTVTLSGVATGSLVGAGAFPTRSTLTFTPTAGTLTLTVTGSVTLAQLEVGAFASSYIPTTSSQVTRAADVAVMTGTNFSSWFNQPEGTWFVEGSGSAAVGPQSRRYFEAGTEASRHFAGYNSSAQARYFVSVSSATSADLLGLSGVAGLNNTKTAGAYKLNDFQAATNGVLSAQDTSGALPAVSQLFLGRAAFLSDDSYLFGHIRRIAYWNTRLTNAELQQITS